MTPITIPAPVLRSAIAVLGKLIANRGTLPVLNHIRIERVQNRIRLSATDLDRCLTYTHLAEPEPITALARQLAELRWPREAGALLVPKGALHAAIKAVDKEGSVTFTLALPPGPIGKKKKDEAAPPPTVHLSYPLNGTVISTPIETLSADDFPPEPQVKAAHACRADATARAAIVEANRFSSDDTTRYVLNGVYVETRCGDKPCLPVVVATDGRRLYRREVPSLAPLNANLILPSGIVALLGHPALIAHDWQLITDRKVEHVQICAGPWKLSGKLVEGNYPNYRQVIPDKAAATAALGPVSHRNLSEILGKLPVPEKKTNSESLTLRFQRDRLGVECPHTKASVVVPGVACDSPKVIHLNRHYLREMLATGPGVFRLIDEMSPLRYDTTSNAVHVVMPMRVA